MSGVALASFFPSAVKMAAATRTGIPEADASFILVLGGLYGIMPDTLDFKMGQFFSVAEYQVDCDPNNPDPGKMARQIGEAMDQASETGKYVRAQLLPMQLGAHYWRQYMIKFDSQTNEVIVVLNEVVGTNQIPFLGTEPENRVGRYTLQKAKLKDAHGRPSVVDIMSGPQYGFRPTKEGTVEVEFLPWHRTWSHSYVLGLILALPWSALAMALGWPHAWLYSLIAFLGFAIHITEDLTGHMGGSLIWPFDATRYDGLAWFRASDPHANFTVDFMAFVMIIRNLMVYSTPPGATGEAMTLMPWYLYYLYFMVIPLAIYHTVAWSLREPKAPKGGEISAAAALAADDARIAALIASQVNEPVQDEADIRREELEFEALDL